MDRITRLQIFKLTAETLSFTRAAAAFGCARSSVTKAINELEEEVGTRLLDRTTRDVSLTAEGAAFLERGRDVLAVFDEAHAMFGEDGAGLGGRVRASVPSRLGRRVIVPALPEFLDTHPEIEVGLRVSHRQDDLVRQGLDFVLRIGDKDDSEFIARHLADTPLIVCASPTYLARHGTPQSIADLERHVTVGYEPPFSRRVWSFPGSGVGMEVEPRRMATAVTASNADIYIAAGVSGLGVMHLPAFDVRDELADGRLVQLLPDVPAWTIPVAIVYAHRRNLTPRVRALVEWMSQIVRQAVRDGEPSHAVVDRAVAAGGG
jgi:DNA-binding transcriptional LysR family regulator